MCSLIGVCQVKNNLVKTKKKDDPSGSRTLLRLHRALEYITAFLDRLEGMKDEDYCSVTSREAYETTLMKYHPWVVQVIIVVVSFHAYVTVLLLESGQAGYGSASNQERSGRQGLSGWRRRNFEESGAGFPQGSGSNEVCIQCNSSFLSRAQSFGHTLSDNRKNIIVNSAVSVTEVPSVF